MLSAAMCAAWKVSGAAKRKLAQEAGSEQPYEKIVRLKLTALDGKQRETDCAEAETLLRIVQSIPSPKAEPSNSEPSGATIADFSISPRRSIVEPCMFDSPYRRPPVSNLPRNADMTEIVFVVECAPEGGYTARALGESIFAEADTEAQLRVAVQDAVHCHFDEGTSPNVIRLHVGREVLLAV